MHGGVCGPSLYESQTEVGYLWAARSEKKKTFWLMKIDEFLDYEEKTVFFAYGNRCLLRAP